MESSAASQEWVLKLDPISHQDTGLFLFSSVKSEKIITNKIKIMTNVIIAKIDPCIQIFYIPNKIQMFP